MLCTEYLDSSRSPRHPDGQPSSAAAGIAAAQSEDLDVVELRELKRRPQLQPWLVPHSVQTPQAPARITLSLPHTEQVIPMKMLPSATVTRSSWPLPLPLCPTASASFVELLVITSITCLSP